MSPGIVAESDLSGNLTSEYVFFNGERVARRDFPSGAVSYYFSDHLKTTDVVTDAQGNIKNESDFYPWGGELQLANADSNHYKFTGKERDAETGLDYFGARYYSNGLGRFITPDWAAKATAVPYAEFADPQSLNLYSYVRNVPTTRLDPDGHVEQSAQDGPTLLPPMPSLSDIGNDLKDSLVSAGQALQNAASATIDTLADVANFALTQYQPQVPIPQPQANCTCPEPASQNSNKQNDNNSYQKSTQQNSGSTKSGNLSKSPRGKGSVPKNQRDPKRTATDKDKASMRQEQNGNCAHCNESLGDEKGIGHHYPDRHADGGSEMKLVHEACHLDLHSCK